MLDNPLRVGETIPSLEQKMGQRFKKGVERPGNLHKKMNTISSFCICSFNLRGFSTNDQKLQMVKLLTATKFHNIIGMLYTNLTQEEVDTMVKDNK